MTLFVLNCGSSSLKYKLFSYEKEVLILAEGMVEKIGEACSFISLNGKKEKILCKNHKTAIAMVEKQLQESLILTDFSSLNAIAHRVVHGGAKFTAATLIDENVITEIKGLISLAPLHNPANLEGILAMRKVADELPQIAFFDTAFHQSMPSLSSQYALPKAYTKNLHIRRYGFHGISHHYLSKTAANILKKNIKECSLITLHLGNGASATAIKNGKSLDTSMGFTPMQGLVMGTRCGDMDSGILLYLERELGMDVGSIDDLLNHESGLKGLCGSNDMREVIEKMQKGEEDAKFAFTLFCRQIKKYIGAYLALLGKVDAIVFSGGIGANSPEVRAEICKEMSHMGIMIDADKNRQNVSIIHLDDAPIALLAIATDEELEMANQTREFLNNTP